MQPAPAVSGLAGWPPHDAPYGPHSSVPPAPPGLAHGFPPPIRGLAQSITGRNYGSQSITGLAHGFPPPSWPQPRPSPPAWPPAQRPPLPQPHASSFAAPQLQAPPQHHSVPAGPAVARQTTAGSEAELLQWLLRSGSGLFAGSELGGHAAPGPRHDGPLAGASPLLLLPDDDASMLIDAELLMGGSPPQYSAFGGASGGGCARGGGELLQRLQSTATAAAAAGLWRCLSQGSDGFPLGLLDRLTSLELPSLEALAAEPGPGIVVAVAACAEAPAAQASVPEPPQPRLPATAPVEAAAAPLEEAAAPVEAAAAPLRRAALTMQSGPAGTHGAGSPPPLLAATQAGTSVALACKGPLNARLATGEGLSFFLSFSPPRRQGRPAPRQAQRSACSARCRASLLRRSLRRRRCSRLSSSPPPAVSWRACCSARAWLRRWRAGLSCWSGWRVRCALSHTCAA
jgi:hypothetical protein